MPCSLLGEATLLQDPGVHHIAPTLYAVIPVKRWVEGAAVVASLRDNSHADNVCRIANVMPNGNDPIFIVSSDSGGYAFLLGNLPPGLVDGIELMFSITFLVNTGCSISFADEMELDLRCNQYARCWRGIHVNQDIPQYSLTRRSLFLSVTVTVSKP